MAGEASSASGWRSCSKKALDALALRAQADHATAASDVDIADNVAESSPRATVLRRTSSRATSLLNPTKSDSGSGAGSGDVTERGSESSPRTDPPSVPKRAPRRTAAVERVRRRSASCRFRDLAVFHPRVDGRDAGQVWRIDMPPSTGMIAPLTKLADGRHRLSVMCATSSGKPVAPQRNPSPGVRLLGLLGDRLPSCPSRSGRGRCSWR